ncbi:hypothetical protein TNCV_4893031 [Trichonephila clavipes]|nr:hypothetical protein TNCV_4893031 [Trichonephila clavipes]
MEKNAVNYDESVLAVCEATTQLLTAGLTHAKTVFFIDSQFAILALSSNAPNDCLNKIQCQTKNEELISYGWTVACSGSQVMLRSPSMKEPTKKPTVENSGHCGANIEVPGERQDVACFRLTTGHDFWEYTFTGLAANEGCRICGHTRMNARAPAPMHWTLSIPG